MPEGIEQVEVEEAVEFEEAQEILDAVEEQESETEDAAEEEGNDSENEEFACGTRKKKYVEEEEDKEEEEAPEEEPPAEETKSVDDDDEKKRVSAQNALEEMEAKFVAMEKELEELRAFKLEQENQKKDALINKYHMLSDEDKAEIIAHKTEYSIDEIEEKLALIYVKKNVDFSTVDGKQEEVEEESSIMTFSLDDSQSAGFVPPMVEALRQVKQSK